MHKRSIRFSILLVILTLFLGFGVSFINPKPVRADALGDFITKLSLGDFIRGLFDGLFGGTAGEGAYTTPTPVPSACEYTSLADCTGSCTGGTCTSSGCSSGRYKCVPRPPTPTPTIVCTPRAPEKGIAGFVQQLLGQGEGPGDGQCVLPTPTPTIVQTPGQNCPGAGVKGCSGSNKLECKLKIPTNNTYIWTVVGQCSGNSLCVGDWECLAPSVTPTQIPTPTPSGGVPNCPVCQTYSVVGMGGWGCHAVPNGTSCGGSNVCTTGQCGPYVNECSWSCDDDNCSANQACEYSDCSLGRKKCDFAPNCGSDPSICTLQNPRKVCVFEDGRYQCMAPLPTPSPIPPTCYEFGTCLDVCGLTNCEGSGCPYERYRCRVPIVTPTVTPIVIPNCGTVNCVAPKVCSNPGPGNYQCVNPTATPTRVPPTPTTNPNATATPTSRPGSTATPTRIPPTPTPTNVPGCAPLCISGMNCMGACVADGCTGNYQRCSLYTPTPTRRPTATTTPRPSANPTPGCSMNACEVGSCSAGQGCILCDNAKYRCGTLPTNTPRPSATSTVRPTATSVPNLSPTVTVGAGTPPPSPYPTNTSVPYPTQPPGPPGPPAATATPTTPVGAPCYYNVKLVNQDNGSALPSALQQGTTETGGCRTQGVRELVPSFFNQPSQATNRPEWPCTDATYVGQSCTQGIVTGQFVCMGGPQHEIKGCYNRTTEAYQRVSITVLSPSPTVTPPAGATVTVTPTQPPVATPTPAYSSFEAWFTIFRSYVDGPTGGIPTTLTHLEDWRNNIPVPTPTPL